MNSKTNQTSSAAYWMASDSEEGDRTHVVAFQDSVFGTEDYDDVDGSSVDATFPALRFRKRSGDQKPNSCLGGCENEDSRKLSLPVSDPESSFHVNHVAVVDSSTSSVDQKFGFGVSVNGTQGCSYESDCSSDIIQDGVLTADYNFSSLKQDVSQEFLSFSALWKEHGQPAGSSSYEKSRDLSRSEIQNDLTDSQYSFPGISDGRPHSGHCPRKHAADVVCSDCSAVRTPVANGISNDLDLAESPCVVKLSNCSSQVIDGNEAGSSVREGASHSVVKLSCEPGTVEGIKRDIVCDGLGHEGNGCDIEGNDDEFYANSFPRPNVTLESHSSQSSTEESQRSQEEPRIDAVGENVHFYECVESDGVEGDGFAQDGYVDDEGSIKDEEEEQKKNQGSPCMTSRESDECSSTKELEGQETQVEEYCDRWECSSYVLKAHNTEEECSEEEERNDQVPGQAGGCEEVEGSQLEELPYRGNTQTMENNGEDEPTWRVKSDSACFKDLHQNRVETHEITPQRRCSDEESWFATEYRKSAASEHLERFHRGITSRGKKTNHCQGKGEEGDMQNHIAGRTSVQSKIVLNRSEDEMKKEFQAVETGSGEIPETDCDTVLSNPKETSVQDEIEEEISSDDEGSEEMQSSDESKEEIQNGDEGKEEIQSGDDRNEGTQSGDERTEEIQSADEGKENTQSGDEENEDIESGDEGNEEMQSVNDWMEGIQNSGEGKEENHSSVENEEEIQGGDERKEGMPSGDVGEEEILSYDEMKEDIQSGNQGKEEIQSGDKGSEETQSVVEVKEEIQSGDKGKEKIQSGDVGNEETRIGDEGNEETQSGDEVKQEIPSGDEGKEEIPSGDEGKEETRSGDKVREETQSGIDGKEEIQSGDEDNAEIQSDDEGKEETESGNEKEKIQSGDEGKEEAQSGEKVTEERQSLGGDVRKEVQDDTKRTKRPAFLAAPRNNNFHPNFRPFILSCTEVEAKAEEIPLQHETKETEVQLDDAKGDELEKVAIEKKVFVDGIDNDVASDDDTELQKYDKNKNEAGSITPPISICASEKMNHCFALNLKPSNTVTQTGNNHSRSNGIETDFPGARKFGQTPCRATTSRFCPINLDYISSNDAVQKVDSGFSNKGGGENCNSRDMWQNRRKELREKVSSSDGKMIKSQSRNLSLSVNAPQGPFDERTELSDIPEKFLVPRVSVVVHSNIMTPQEDLGFAKVPGYVPRLDSMEEESEVVADGAPDEPQPAAEREIDVTVDKKTSLPETRDSKLDRNQTDSLDEKLNEVRAGSGTLRLGARPKELPSSLQLPMPSSAPLPLSPKFQLSPKPPSKSARPNSLIGLSKPDVNLPPLKDASAIHEDSPGLIRVKRQDIPSLTGKRFSFPGRNFAPSTLTEVPFPTSTFDAAETSANKLSTLSTFPSSIEVLPASESRATSRLLAQRPTSWSQPPLKAKSVLPRRPNSLNITVSNMVPIQTPETGATTLGLQVPQGTPCLAGSMVVSQSPGAAVLPPSSEEPLDVPGETESNKSYRTGVPDSSSRDSPASVSAMSPPISSNINLRITELGKVAPVWVPDGDAPRCMQCESRFTFTRRRHHCRACGKVFCSGCCNVKVRLGYLDQKEGRVCSRCYQDLLCAQLYENLSASASRVVNTQISAAERTRLSSSASSVPLAGRGTTSSNVLKKEKSIESKPVSVLDSCYHSNSLLQDMEGGKAGADTAAILEKLNTGNSKDNRFKSSLSLLSKAATTVVQVPVALEVRQVTQPMTRGPRTPLWPDCNGLNLNVAVMTEASLPSKFTLLPNLKVSVSIVNLDCCMDRVCWCFVTSGLCAVGQDEVVIVLERLPDEERIPSDVFYHICNLYHEAAKGHPVGYLGHTLVGDGQVLLESADHAGFLYLRPTFQCLQKLPLPPAPYLFGILVHRTEVPWLQVFPIRLMLRLGAQYRYYPCPLVSMRFREPVYREVGHTIMNLLVDLRNFQYRLPRVDGLVVHMEDKKTFINLPRCRYKDIKRAFNNNNDHIVALEVSFSCVADSHLVCFQNPEGKYITQAINIQNRPRKITGASFVVFNGALRPISGMHAKCSMVEDGLMVQVSAESMHQLKLSISSAEDYSIGCGRLSGPEPEEWVILKWVDEEKDVKTRPSFNRIQSPIDGMVLDGARSRRLSTSTDYVSKSLAIRWTEIFYVENPADSRQEVDEEFEEALAQACCMVLCGHLEELQLPALTRIGLRVTLGSEQFGYKIGANCRRLPDVCLSDLDSKLIPVLESPQGRYKGVSSTLELFFYLLEQQQQPPQPQHLSPEP